MAKSGIHKEVFLEQIKTNNKLIIVSGGDRESLSPRQRF
jgi:hypothetical protein